MSQHSQQSLDWKESVLKILGKLMARRDTEEFRNPVPWEELGLTDYPEIVEKPMDLSTVIKNINDGLYLSKEECAADIRLIWSNSLLYNAPRSKIYATTKLLSELWESMWSTIATDDIAKPPSMEDIRQWTQECHRLSPDELGKLLKFIDNNCPKVLIKRLESNEVEVNVDLIPGKHFRKLQALTRQCIQVESTNVSNDDLSKKRKHEELGFQQSLKSRAIDANKK